MKLRIFFTLLTLAVIGAQQSSASGRISSPLFHTITNKTIVDASEDPPQSGGSNQTASFINIDGPNLKARMEMAVRTGKSSANQTSFWVAYTFDVRPGVAIDANVHEFSGSMNTVSDTTILLGTNNGISIETRNLGFFILYNKSDGTLRRTEIYNLDRRREYSGYPVYWLGRANNAESLEFLKGLANSTNDSRSDYKVAEISTLAIGIHDDPSVASILKDFVRTSKQRRIRTTAVFWLGQFENEQPFLTNLVRDENEDTEVRKQAAYAIGMSKSPAAIGTLENLYKTVSPTEVRKQIIFAVSQNDDKKRSAQFLKDVAANDEKPELRKQAIFWLGQNGSDASIDELSGIYANERDTDVKKQVLFAYSQNDNPAGRAKLVEVAQSGDNRELRKQAIFWLGQRGGDGAIDDLANLFANERDTEMKKQFMFAFSQHNSQRAHDKLVEAAKSDPSVEVRKQAIFWLGQKGDESTVDDLMKIYEADQSTEIRKQILFSFSQMHNKRASEKLAEVARTASEVEVRKQAIFWIGQGQREDAVSLLTQLYSTEQSERVKEHIIFSLSQIHSKAAVQKLIDVAKNDSSVDMRKKAMFWLGQSQDPEAIEFFKNILR